MATSAKFELPDAPVTSAVCRACGLDRKLDEYRVFALTPKKLLMDFCAYCEQKHSTLQLYRRYNAYGTQQITEAVFKAARVPEDKRTAEQTRLLVEPAPEVAVETPEQVIQLELQRRELARRRLLYFVTTMMPTYMPGWVHQDICRRLERFMKQVEQRESPRLILAVPPRHGKSQLASDMLPSWILGHHPEWELVIASYAQELPVQFSRSIRSRIESPEYKTIFPKTEIARDARGVEAWKTTADGGLKAIGVGGGLTGHGGNILIGDDLIKDAMSASSEDIRDNAWDWYKMVFRNRLAPGGGILLIGTRWHWHDPIGRVLELDEEQRKQGVPDYERENWEVISYPAIAEGDEYLMRDGTIQRDPPNVEESLRLLRKKGDALHPERYPLPELKKIRGSYTSANWSALYQQRPTPDEGSFFKRDDIVYRWLDPAYYPLCRLFITADYAIKKGQRNDYTVVGVFALDAEDNLYLIDLRRGRWGTYEIASTIVTLIEMYKPEVYAGEQGQIHSAVWPVVEKALAEKRLSISVDDTLTPTTDKEVRARPMQARAQRRKLLLSHNTASKPQDYETLETEMLQFPNGVHDDTVDCVAWACRLAHNISLPQKRKPPPPKSWRDQLVVVSGGQSFMAG